VNESNLIDQARQGDESAWATLVYQHQEAAFRLAYLLLGNADDAQDVAQETFIRAFYALDRFDSTRPLRPWLLTITTNLARNKRRAMSRYLAALGRWLQGEPDRVGPNPQDENLRQWETQTLWQAIRRLSLVDQEIIYLRYFLELSVAETAEVVNIAPGTVKSRLHRALNRLREVVVDEFPILREEYVG
jgi:RNA polymerase sigma-70 factor (ECF subfamily)